MRFLLLLTLLLLICSLRCQETDTVPYLIKDKEYKIYNGMDPQVKSQFLAELKAKNVEVAPFSDVEFPVRVTFKNGKQNLMRYGELEFIHKKDLDSIDFFTRASQQMGVTFGIENGKHKIIIPSFYLQKLNKKNDSWDTIIWRNKDSYENILSELGEIESYGYYPMPEFLIKEDKKWGLICISEDFKIQVIIPPIYEDRDDIELEEWPWHYIPDFEYLRNKLKIDLILPFNGDDDLLVTRDPKNLKWGVVSTANNQEMMIAAEFDSIRSYKDISAIIVWKNNQVGIFSEDGTEVYPAKFSDFEFVNLDYMWGIALKENGSWSLYDITEPKKIIEQKADNTEQLIEYWLNR